MYTYMYMYMYVCVYMYIYRERERDTYIDMSSHYYYDQLYTGRQEGEEEEGRRQGQRLRQVGPREDLKQTRSCQILPFRPIL